MKKLKLLNLYAGIGGNRKLWDNVEVTSVELDPETAEVYSDYFPNDKLIVGDAHKYLLDNYKEFDFIWSSPPCPTHSRLNTTKNGRGDIMMQYPDMQLYQQVIFLDNWFKGKYVVENVIPYYDVLIPAKKCDRHLWWSNFRIGNKDFKRPFNMANATVNDYEKFLGYDLSKYKLKNKIKNLRNCVIPETGKYILDCARGTMQDYKTEQFSIFNDLEQYNTKEL